VGNNLALTREQDFFVGGALTYSVTARDLLQQDALRRQHGLMKKAMAVIVVESPLALFLVLFRSGVLPWPTGCSSGGRRGIRDSEPVGVARSRGAGRAGAGGARGLPSRPSASLPPAISAGGVSAPPTLDLFDNPAPLGGWGARANPARDVQASDRRDGSPRAPPAPARPAPRERARRRQLGSGRGRRKTKREPWPGSLSAQMRPP
jgi:hypothetical protein